jgi:two-component system CheB/CheR fusion protein
MAKQIATHDGRWYTVRIIPYRTLEDKIDSVVMTFLDITTMKLLEADLQEVRTRLNAKSKLRKRKQEGL